MIGIIAVDTDTDRGELDRLAASHPDVSKWLCLGADNWAAPDKAVIIPAGRHLFSSTEHKAGDIVVFSGQGHMMYRRYRRAELPYDYRKFFVSEDIKRAKVSVEEKKVRLLVTAPSLSDPVSGQDIEDLIEYMSPSYHFYINDDVSVDTRASSTSVGVPHIDKGYYILGSDLQDLVFVSRSDSSVHRF